MHTSGANKGSRKIPAGVSPFTPLKQLFYHLERVGAWGIVPVMAKKSDALKSLNSSLSATKRAKQNKMSIQSIDTHPGGKGH